MVGDSLLSPYNTCKHRLTCLWKQVSEEVPSYLSSLYNISGKVGEGTYGVVYLAHTKDPHRKLLAIKTFKPGKEGDGVSITAIREIMLLRELRHPNIVSLEAVHVSRKEASLSLAFVYADTDLYEMVKFHREKDRGSATPQGFHPYTLKSLVWQLLQGMNAMHQDWMLHRDLKPSNILVMGQGPEHGTLKIADFGLARIFRGPLRALSDNGVVVTIWYRAPELLLGAQHYTPAVDVWAAGCIFGELVTLRPLFQGEERKQPAAVFQSDQIDKIFGLMGPPDSQTWPEVESLQHWRANTENVRMRVPRTTAGRTALPHHIQAASRSRGFVQDCAAVDLLLRMLEYNPAKRITAAAALQHPYFKEEPLPGMAAFVHNGTKVAAYPRRARLPPTAPAPPAEDASYKDLNAPPVQVPSRGVTPHGKGPSPAPAMAARVAGGQAHQRLAPEVPPGLPKRRRTDLGPGFR